MTKYCIDCKHFNQEKYLFARHNPNRCYHPDLVTINVIFGTTASADANRERQNDLCGRNARLFDPKPQQPTKLTWWQKVRHISYLKMKALSL